jgi:DNA repair protein RadC
MEDAAYSVTIKELPQDDRPRERLEAFGTGALGNAELIAILLGGGFRNVSALGLAQTLLREHGSLAGIARADLHALRATKGIGLAKAASLLAAFELGRRVASLGAIERFAVGTPEDAAALLMPRYADLEREQVGMLALDTKHRIIREEVVSIGILDGSMVHPREMYRPAILANAAAIVMFHNHPSGDPAPSTRDVEITRRIRDAGVLIGIELLDHLILARSGFVSLKRQGLLD